MLQKVLITLFALFWVISFSALLVSLFALNVWVLPYIILMSAGFSLIFCLALVFLDIVPQLIRRYN
ncbi:MAG: hypothetical protein FWG68_12730 [Defluviitaleaceae bacterium]|nr:hypothetical protein [Defluviitaleaceae bacterium]